MLLPILKHIELIQGFWLNLKTIYDVEQDEKKNAWYLRRLNFNSNNVELQVTSEFIGKIISALVTFTDGRGFEESIGIYQCLTRENNAPVLDAMPHSLSMHKSLAINIQATDRD